MRRSLLTLVALAALAALAAGALAAQPKAGYRYVGNVTGGGYHQIVFDVSRSGKRVQHVKTIGLPSFCGGEGSTGAARFGDARIKGSRFLATGRMLVKGKLVAKATLRGKFNSPSGAKGTVKVTYPGESSCNGTGRFSAIAGGRP